MGRERQKFKNRSSVPHARLKPRSKKLLVHRSDPIIASHWNPRQTPRQNYERLGLATKLGRYAGGTVNTEPPGSARASIFLPGYEEVTLVRDAHSGGVTLLPSDSSAAEESQDETRSLDQHTLNISVRAAAASHSVVRELEASASQVRERTQPTPSATERDWVERVVSRFGIDEGAIAKIQRHKKLNVWQYSEGEIRRRIRRWEQWRARTKAEAAEASG